jgi:hypothetical protein
MAVAAVVVGATVVASSPAVSALFQRLLATLTFFCRPFVGIDETYIANHVFPWVPVHTRFKSGDDCQPCGSNSDMLPYHVQ